MPGSRLREKSEPKRRSNFKKKLPPEKRRKERSKKRSRSRESKRKRSVKKLSLNNLRRIHLRSKLILLRILSTLLRNRLTLEMRLKTQKLQRRIKTLTELQLR